MKFSGWETLQMQHNYTVMPNNSFTGYEHEMFQKG